MKVINSKNVSYDLQDVRNKEIPDSFSFIYKGKEIFVTMAGSNWMSPWNHIASTSFSIASVEHASNLASEFYHVTVGYLEMTMIELKQAIIEAVEQVGYDHLTSIANGAEVKGKAFQKKLKASIEKRLEFLEEALDENNQFVTLAEITTGFNEEVIRFVTHSEPTESFIRNHCKRAGHSFTGDFKVHLISSEIKRLEDELKKYQ